jgi:hypothetical protein
MEFVKPKTIKMVGAMTRPIILIVTLSVYLSACAGLAVPTQITDPVILPIDVQPSPTTPLPMGADLLYPIGSDVELTLFNVPPEVTMPLLSESATGEIIAHLPADTHGIFFTGDLEEINGSVWLNVTIADQQGWLPAANVSEYLASDEFCADVGARVLIADLMAAIVLEDSVALGTLTSPIHGLYLRHNWWNDQLWIPPGRVPELFEDDTVLDWGIADGSGEPIHGTFSDVLLPGLQEVFAAQNQSLVCDDLDNATGPTTGYTIVSPGYENINYYVVYRPAVADQNEFDWRSFAIGIEYVNGTPYVLFVIMYRWEI